jgi:hypothetical protein
MGTGRARLQRAKETARPPKASSTAAIGNTHTKMSTPDAGGLSRMDGP